jgi:putative YphP/YqiW family bacilliredoxin
MARISLNSLLGNEGPNYAEAIASPYREELTQAGFEQLFTPSDVDAALDSQNDDVQLVVLNSVCGCAARVARPGAILSLVHDLVPDHRLTLFAGMEKEAVAHFREKYLTGITPSSPNIAIFKNGALQFILQRYQVENMTADAIAQELQHQYDQICKKQQTKEDHIKLTGILQEKYQFDRQHTTFNS